LVLPSDLSIVNDADVSSGIAVSWTDDSVNGIGDPDDQLHLLVVKGEDVQVLHPGTPRAAGTVDLTLPFSMGVVQVYAYFGAPDGSEFSTDQHEMVMLT